MTRLSGRHSFALAVIPSLPAQAGTARNLSSSIYVPARFLTTMSEGILQFSKKAEQLNLARNVRKVFYARESK
jgi:hypothetical protein